MAFIRDKYPTLPREYTKAKFPPDPEPVPGSRAKQPRRSTANPELAAAGTTGNSLATKPYTQQDEGEKWNTLVKALRVNRQRLLRMRGVTAVDLGYKIVDGSFTNELAVRVHVERKLHDDYLKENRPDDFLPRSGATLPPEQVRFRLKGYEDVPTDVIEAKYKPAQLAEPPRPAMVFEKPTEEADRRKRLDPLVGGISIGSPQVPVGTLGALVWDNTDGRVCILSNWHVLAGDLHVEAGNPCFQPGRFDQGRSNDVVAHLKRWRFDSQTDAAIAELNGSRHYCAGEILSLFQQISGEAAPHLGMVVLKSGRSTEFTWGFVDGLYFSSVIEYSNGIIQVFEDQIHIAPVPPDEPTKPVPRISEPGDSGSVWVTETEDEGYKAVGLHFAGDLPHSAFGEYALANPMTIVRKRLDFSFRPRFLEIRAEDVVTAPPPSPFELHVNGNGNGNGVHPSGHVGGGRFTRPGGQPDPIQPGSN